MLSTSLGERDSPLQDKRLRRFIHLPNSPEPTRAESSEGVMTRRLTACSWTSSAREAMSLAESALGITTGVPAKRAPKISQKKSAKAVVVLAQARSPFCQGYSFHIH